MSQRCRSLSKPLDTIFVNNDRRLRSLHWKSGSSRPRQRKFYSTRQQLDDKKPAEIEREIKERRTLKEDLRMLLRDIAQPVAVITSFMPSTDSNNGFPKPGTSPERLNTTKFHGATLSSFTSIAMDPYPLVAFALRIPSRMATTLRSLSSPSSLSTFQPASSTPSAHMVINLLSASQAPEAVMFSRPDLYPEPFATEDATKFSLTKEGLPVLHDVVGALSCKIVTGPIPLYDLEYFGAGLGAKAREPVLDEGGVASELFIARVVRVENVENLSSGKLEEWERTQPLIYHRRGYTSCSSR
jgi:flavin reductase (DIM6/NTAB) family NADH-FMN oxidoreductase RutF